MAVTIKDIARKAGVSHSTVSRALRDDVSIPPRTAQRIKRLAAKMGYVPSAVACSLKMSQTGFSAGQMAGRPVAGRARNSF